MAYFRQDGDLIAAPFGSNVIKRGQLVTVDTAGNAKAAETGQKAFLGVAMENTADTTSGVVRIYRTGVFPITVASLSAADLGKSVAVANANAATTTTSGNTVIGQIVEIIDNKTAGVRLV